MSLKNDTPDKETCTEPTPLQCSGTAFVILSKAKGWWVVQKDSEGTGDIDMDEAQSGWVPAGKSIVL